MKKIIIIVLLTATLIQGLSFAKDNMEQKVDNRITMIEQAIQ